MFLDAARTESVCWAHHVAAVIKTADGDRVVDPALFRQSAAVDDWQERITHDSMEGVTFRRSSRLAYQRPFDYEGDSIARDKMLAIREQKLDQMTDVSVLPTLASVAKYRRALFADELMASDPGQGERFVYCRNHHEYFRRVWTMSWPAHVFLENLGLAGAWFGIPGSQVASEFDRDDPLLQAQLQIAYWEHMVDALGKVEAISKKLQNLSNTSDEAQQYQEWMESERVRDVWLSPFGGKFWAKFGLEVPDQ